MEGERRKIEPESMCADTHSRQRLDVTAKFLTAAGGRRKPSSSNSEVRSCGTSICIWPHWSRSVCGGVPLRELPVTRNLEFSNLYIESVIILFRTLVVRPNSFGEG